MCVGRGRRLPANTSIRRDRGFKNELGGHHWRRGGALFRARKLGHGWTKTKLRDFARPITVVGQMATHARLPLAGAKAKGCFRSSCLKGGDARERRPYPVSVDPKKPRTHVLSSISGFRWAIFPRAVNVCGFGYGTFSFCKIVF